MAHACTCPPPRELLHSRPRGRRHPATGRSFCCWHKEQIVAAGPNETAPRQDSAAPNRRRDIAARLTAACLGVFAALLLSRDGHAQAYPDRPITYIVPRSPGTSPTIAGRIIAQTPAKITQQ